MWCLSMASACGNFHYGFVWHLNVVFVCGDRVSTAFVCGVHI